MKIQRDANYKTQEKKLKKFPKEQETYEKIINHIKQCNTITDLENHSFSGMYGYEALRGDLSRIS